MSRAIASISRRKAIINTAGGMVAASALRASIAHAAPISDPIFALIDKCDRLSAEARRLRTLANAAYASVNWDASGCGCAPLDPSLPFLVPVIEWFKAKDDGECDGTFRPTRFEMEQFNRQAELADVEAQHATMPKLELVIRIDEDGIVHHDGPRRRVSEQTQAENAERLAWWDRRHAERKHNAEVSGAGALEEQIDELWGQHSDALDDLYHAKPVTIAGAMAQLRIAIQGIKEAHAPDEDGEFAGDFDNYGVFNAYDALSRLLPAEQA